LAYDFDTDPQKMSATTDMYTESAWDFMMATSTDLSEFKNRGGKLIIANGVSDSGCCWIGYLIDWWDEVNMINDGTASDFVRLFAIPGGGHGFGGPATGQIDALSVIVDWVENGISPDRIIGTVGDNSPWPNRTRPLCPYPKQARYRGSGSIEDASNFECREVSGGN
jgi:hypothetical protein